jgi:hypothetical protein
MKKAVTVIALALSLIFIFSGCVLSGKITEFTSYLNGSTYTTASGTVSVSDISSIDIYWVYGSVKIEESDTDKVTFSEGSSLDGKKDSLGEATENKELGESLKMRYKTDGGKLMIQFCKSGLRVRAGAIKDLKKDLTIYVPKGAKYDEIKADVVSSDVYMAYLHTDKIVLNSVSADMKLVSCETDRIKCDTVSGKLTVSTDDTVNEIDMDAVSGDLKVTARSVSKIEMDSVSANAELTLQKFDFTLKLTGVSTSLDADGISFEKTGEKNYKFGDGTGDVKFESVSGKVRLEEK